MSIRITLLWWTLLVTVGYDLVVAALGIFPAHTLQDRIAEDVKIAFFIGLAWFLSKLYSKETGR